MFLHSPRNYNDINGRAFSILDKNSIFFIKVLIAVCSKFFNMHVNVPTDKHQQDDDSLSRLPRLPTQTDLNLENLLQKVIYLQNYKNILITFLCISLFLTKNVKTQPSKHFRLATQHYNSVLIYKLTANTLSCAPFSQDTKAICPPILFPDVEGLHRTPRCSRSCATAAARM